MEFAQKLFYKNLKIQTYTQWEVGKQLQLFLHTHCKTLYMRRDTGQVVDNVMNEGIFNIHTDPTTPIRRTNNAIMNITRELWWAIFRSRPRFRKTQNMKFTLKMIEEQADVIRFVSNAASI